MPFSGKSKKHIKTSADILAQSFLEIKDIQVAGDAGQGLSDTEWKLYGLPGFNNVELKPGTRQLLTISGRPLLVMGQYGKGKTVVFTGFTPVYSEKKSPWDPKLNAPYALDQEFVTHPVTKAYFDLFVRVIAAATSREASGRFWPNPKHAGKAIV